ncbi:hypothetical protein [Thermoplasma acidophilum]|uniref:hypothetical protein n=1 Tax=Thermoplasma acidophilum TaxID=2303 RepID=UPI0012EA6BC4|nr:hypothetical protein [Thermoplasma acidophilum]MCY0851334.1 hypothetical protein [Thermoplasma acidophilum]
MTLVEIKSKIEDVLYIIYAISHLINNQAVGTKELKLVCAGKTIEYSIHQLAKKLGVETLLIPPKLYQYLSVLLAESGVDAYYQHVKTSQLKITSEKAWKIICSSMADKPSSILSISRKTNVSFGWANYVIHRLKNARIISMACGLRLKDLDRPFNVVSWKELLMVCSGRP